VVLLIRGWTNKHEGVSLLCQRDSLIPNSRLYILAVDTGAAQRLTALAESWGAEPHIYNQEDTARALGTSCTNERLVQMWWD
jgi:hypothetical protein